jgi:hypothetical protein
MTVGTLVVEQIQVMPGAVAGERRGHYVRR